MESRPPRSSEKFDARRSARSFCRAPDACCNRGLPIAPPSKHDAPMNRVALRARAVPAPIRAVCILVPLAVAAYWCVAFAGPYRWLAEIQIDASGGYEVVLTGVVTVLIALLPSIVII